MLSGKNQEQSLCCAEAQIVQRAAVTMTLESEIMTRDRRRICEASSLAPCHLYDVVQRGHWKKARQEMIFYLKT
jgi:hypothetical protein